MIFNDNKSIVICGPSNTTGLYLHFYKQLRNSVWQCLNMSKCVKIITWKNSSYQTTNSLEPEASSNVKYVIGASLSEPHTGSRRWYIRMSRVHKLWMAKSGANGTYVRRTYGRWTTISKDHGTYERYVYGRWTTICKLHGTYEHRVYRRSTSICKLHGTYERRVNKC